MTMPTSFLRGARLAMLAGAGLALCGSAFLFSKLRENDARDQRSIVQRADHEAIITSLRARNVAMYEHLVSLTEEIRRQADDRRASREATREFQKASMEAHAATHALLRELMGKGGGG